MLKQVISQGDFAIWPQLSLLVFTFTFLFILWRTYRKKVNPHYEQMARLAVEDTHPEQRND